MGRGQVVGRPLPAVVAQCPRLPPRSRAPPLSPSAPAAHPPVPRESRRPRAALDPRLGGARPGFALSSALIGTQVTPTARTAGTGAAPRGSASVAGPWLYVASHSPRRGSALSAHASAAAGGRAGEVLVELVKLLVVGGDIFASWYFWLCLALFIVSGVFWLYRLNVALSPTTLFIIPMLSPPTSCAPRSRRRLLPGV